MRNHGYLPVIPGWPPGIVLGRKQSGGAAPVNTVAPAVTGTETEGETLSCTSGTWTGDPTITYAYQWYRGTTDVPGVGPPLTDGDGNYIGIAIGGATTSTYLLVAGDVDEVIFCDVTATNGNGSALKSSNYVGPVEASFVPTDLASLVAWYDAADSVYSDAGVTLAVNNAEVEQWNDKSGNNYHLTERGVDPALFKTAGLNGLPSIFAQAGAFAVLGIIPADSVVMGTGTGLTVFAVCTLAGSSGGYGRLVAYIGTSGNDYDHTGNLAALLQNNGAAEVFNYRNGVSAPAASVSLNTPMRIGTRYNGTNNRMYLNGVEGSVQASSPATQSPGNLRIGTSNGDTWYGHFSEIIICNAGLSDSDVALVDDYLAAKWGF